MPILDIDPGNSPESPGTLSFYAQGADPSTGVQMTTGGVLTAPGGIVGPVSGASAAYTGATAGADVITAKVTGDTQQRFIINADGKLEWGPGNAATDVSLNRYAVGGLEVSGALRFTNGQLLFGAGGDVNLYKSAADTLKTDDALVVAGALNAQGYTVLESAQTNGNLTVFGTAIVLGTAGGGLQVKEGANACLGTATLNGTTAVVVNTTKVTATSRIMLTINTPGGTPASPYVSTRVAGTSFSVKSTGASDTSVVAWHIIEPAA